MRVFLRGARIVGGQLLTSLLMIGGIFTIFALAFGVWYSVAWLYRTFTSVIGAGPALLFLVLTAVIAVCAVTGWFTELSERKTPNDEDDDWAW